MNIVVMIVVLMMNGEPMVDTKAFSSSLGCEIDRTKYIKNFNESDMAKAGLKISFSQCKPMLVHKRAYLRM